MVRLEVRAAVVGLLNLLTLLADTLAQAVLELLVKEVLVVQELTQAVVAVVQHK
jgi:hypothetical protein